MCKLLGKTRLNRGLMELHPLFSLNSFQKLRLRETTYVDPADVTRLRMIEQIGRSLYNAGSCHCSLPVQRPMLTPAEILGPHGRLAKRLPHYEQRGEQLAMADAVAKAIAKGGHLVVEAGTGVGKSFGYLVPAILAAAAEKKENEEGVRRVVVATHTISLQEQLVQKDLPLLNAVIPLEFTSVLVKGAATI